MQGRSDEATDGALSIRATSSTGQVAAAPSGEWFRPGKTPPSVFLTWGHPGSKKLMNHYGTESSHACPLWAPQQFDRITYHVDYAFHKVKKPRSLSAFFKAGQAVYFDLMTAAFSEI